MRARPSKKQEEAVQREMCYRLVIQMVRLAKCLAVVLNKDELDEEVMKRVRKVALDTSSGRTIKIATLLYDSEMNHDRELGGLTMGTLAFLSGETEDKLRNYVRFLRRLGIVEEYQVEKKQSALGGTWKKYRLTERLRDLYKKVVHE